MIIWSNWERKQTNRVIDAVGFEKHYGPVLVHDSANLPAFWS
jgi:hypothetical protein